MTRLFLNFALAILVTSCAKPAPVQADDVAVTTDVAIDAPDAVTLTVDATPCC